MHINWFAYFNRLTCGCDPIHEDKVHLAAKSAAKIWPGELDDITSAFMLCYRAMQLKLVLDRNAEKLAALTPILAETTSQLNE